MLINFFFSFFLFFFFSFCTMVLYTFSIIIFLGASGGICEKYKSYTENIAGRQVQTKRSLNTGVITFVNYNSRVPPKVSELTLAHEKGQNFGSPVSKISDFFFFFQVITLFFNENLCISA